MKIFWERLQGKKTPWTKDAILHEYRFTNVYRATDRVSQYLIRKVIYSNLDLSPEDVALRIIIFKIFNKIETWEHIENTVGRITVSNFKIDRICKVLEERRRCIPIFNNAYMMTGTHSLYNHLNFKHEKWLAMVASELLGKRILHDILKSESLEAIYRILRSCSFLGDFLAYQYAIDLNYSPLFCFDENSFVKAGIGAVRGIKKCFEVIDTKKIEDAILFTQEHFIELQQEFGYTGFRPLFNRLPTLIDLQNCFCETDKYLRAKRPDLVLDNTRIKQKYKQTTSFYSLCLPPFWKIHSEVALCM
jgi:hypothetical protein